MKLEEKLVSLRKAKGLSQMKLAEKMNVSRQAISRWETGAAIPSSENLKYLSDLYTFHFTSGSNGSIKTNIQIDKTGKYYFAVRNNENETVEVLGYVYY